jgi:hypothetical protein
MDREELRLKFAIAAMQELISIGGTSFIGSDRTRSLVMNEVSRSAFEMADKMLDYYEKLIKNETKRMA